MPTPKTAKQPQPAGIQEPAFDTTNPEAITYNTGELLFTVLGGIRLDGLDRMRVTLKTEVINRNNTRYLNNAELAGLAMRHNLDLYNDSQTEKLVRKCSERLETGSIGLTKALAGLTAKLEEYRLAQITQRDHKPDSRKSLTDTEKNEALTFLSSPDLLRRTGEAVGRSGVTGEETNRLLMYIIFTSRKTAQPLHCISLGGSGTGKTHLQESVGALIPDEDKMETTTLSENAFYYFGQQELRHKLILIEDLDGAENALYPLRELQSKKKISKTVAHKDARGNTRTVHLTVEGPVSVAGCTTKESIYEDNANRSFLLYLDESPEQDERIMEYQRKRSAGTVNTAEEHHTRRLLQNTQRLLQPVAVRNPFAERLMIPAGVFKPRRTNAHYLQFIEAITFYHQHQREHKADENTGEIYIETTPEDIEAANLLLRETLLRKSDELNTACRRYFEHLKTYLQTQNKTGFTAKEVRHALRVNHGNQKRYMLQLLYNNYIRKGTGTRSGAEHGAQRNNAKGYLYEITDPEEYNQLRAGIDTVLDGILATIKAGTLLPESVYGRLGSLPIEEAQPDENPTTTVHGSPAVHYQNEPHNQAEIIDLTEPVHKTTGTSPNDKKTRTRRTPEEASATTLATLLKATENQPETYIPVSTVAEVTGLSYETESRNLKALTEAGKAERIWKNRQYLYKPNIPAE